MPIDLINNQRYLALEKCAKLNDNSVGVEG